MATVTAEQAGSIGLIHLLDVIAFSEGTSTSQITEADGYDVIASGVNGPEIFSDMSIHPFANGKPAKLVRRAPLLTSTASGRYQHPLESWAAYKKALELPDFSPLSQDLIALAQIKERRADALMLSGNVSAAICACSAIWASMPINSFEQGGRPMATLLMKFAELAAESVNK